VRAKGHALLQGSQWGDVSGRKRTGYTGEWSKSSALERCGVSGSCEKTLIERKLKIVASRRGQNLLCGLSKSGNKLVVICNYVWLN
jgi:hypothetical protein